MPFFTRFRSATGGMSDGTSGSAKAAPKPEAYKHIPTHAARDARSQVPPLAREKDRDAIAEHHKRRSQMPEIPNSVLRLNTGAEVNGRPVGRRDVPYMSKEMPSMIYKRPTTTLEELKSINAQRKTRASRRAAHVEPTADISYHLKMLPSPQDQSISSTTNVLDRPSIPLPIRTHPPLNKFINDLGCGSCDESDAMQGNTVEISDMPTRSNSSCGSTVSATTKSTASSTGSQEPLDPGPPRNRARDSLSHTIIQDARFNKPNSRTRRRLRAAAHDSTGIEQAMASPESFRPQRAPPAIVRNDSAYPTLPMAGFDFGTERPYSPERLRPWLVNGKKNAFQCTSRVSSI